MEQRKKLMAIVNPFSGNSKKERFPQLLDEVIDHTRFDVEVAFVTRELRVSDLAAQAVEQALRNIMFLIDTSHFIHQQQTKLPNGQNGVQTGLVK